MIIKEQNKRDLKRLKAVLKTGGISILPAFTVYGFSASLFNKYANLKIFKLKKRMSNSPFIVIAQKEFIFNSADNINKDKLEFLLQNGITVVVKTSLKFPFYASRSYKTAFRLANTDLLKYAASSFPIISTSVNISGKKDINDIKTIAHIYGTEVDIIVKGKIENMVSSVVELEHNTVSILRKGHGIEKVKELIL